MRLIVSDDELPATLPDGVEAIAYEGFTTGPLDGPLHALRLVGERSAGGRRSPAARSLAVSLPRQPATSPRPLLDARAVKDELALAELRRALAAADAGQAALRAIADDAVGASEIELFCDRARGDGGERRRRVPVLADLVSGPRTAGMGGAPQRRVVGEGDPILCDLAPRVGGRWGDSVRDDRRRRRAPRARQAHARSTRRCSVDRRDPPRRRRERARRDRARRTRLPPSTAVTASAARTTSSPALVPIRDRLAAREGW